MGTQFMTDGPPCPPREALVHLMRGDLRGEVLETVCDHVDTCVSCQRTLDEIDDGPSEIARQFAGVTPHALDLARAAIEADTRAITTVSGWVAELKTQRASSPEPTLPLPCDLRQYRVTRLIGQGGMGEVYEALHMSLKRRVALKVIQRVRLDDPVAHGCFIREIEAAGQLDHPNLVRAYDAWEQDGYLFLTQEFLDGESLQSLAARGGCAEPSDILAALIPICRGVEHLHSHRLLHRDIKPANIMQLRDGTIKLIDYGLAIASGASATAGMSRAGTVGYMSPEQAQGTSPVDERSDLYAVGCVLKYLLKHLPSPAPPGSEGTLQESLQQISRRLTQAFPEDRPQTMAEVRQHLEQLSLSEGLPDTQHPGVDIPEAPRAGKMTHTIERRHLRWTGMGGLLLLGSLLTWRVPTRTPGIPIEPPSVPNTAAAGTEVSTPAAPVPPPAAPREPIDRTRFPLRLVEVPAGEFVMGGVEDDPKLMAIETPARAIRFPQAFRISECEITVGQFREFIKATGYVTEAVQSGEGGWLAARSTSFSIRDPESSWENPGHQPFDALPVTTVTYRDAVTFCDWLSQREQRPYRLPTEAEWEYCCRAGDPTVFYFPLNRRNDFSWTLRNLGDHIAPRPVGTRKPNAWGLYDMIGNVREWCLDWYSPTAYEADAAQFPAGPLTGQLRVIRGASFMDEHLFLRSSNRGYLDPSTACQNQGFRVVQAGEPAVTAPMSRERSR